MAPSSRGLGRWVFNPETPVRIRSGLLEITILIGDGVIGNTMGSGPIIEGSSPSPRANRLNLAPSSRGLGRCPLKAETPVRIRSGLLEYFFYLYQLGIFSLKSK